MDFELSSEQKDIKNAAREFAEKEFVEIARECDSREEYPRKLLKKACELGFVGMFIDEKYGGAGLGLLETAIVVEEFSRIDAGCGTILQAASEAEIIQEFGTEAQKNKYLPIIAGGKVIVGSAIVEPEADSDILAVDTRAGKQGDKYVVNGKKAFVANGSIADLLLVFCLTSPDEIDSFKRHSFLIAERNEKGIQSKRITGKMGLRAFDTAEILFDNVTVSQSNLVGDKENQGFEQFKYIQNVNRIIAASQAIGVAQGAFDRAVSYVKSRVQFGKTISAFQGTQFKVADMVICLELARTMLYRACWRMDGGKSDALLASIAKHFACEMAVKVTDEALQMHGGYGYFAEYDMERYYRDAKIIELYAGTKEIEKLSIAGEALGVDLMYNMKQIA